MRVSSGGVPSSVTQRRKRRRKGHRVNDCHIGQQVSDMISLAIIFFFKNLISSAIIFFLIFQQTTMAAGVLPQNEKPYSTLVNNSGYAAANMDGNNLFSILCVFVEINA